MPSGYRAFMTDVMSMVMANRPIMKGEPNESSYPQCNQYFGHIEVTHNRYSYLSAVYAASKRL
jgi:hypothetical protein